MQDNRKLAKFCAGLIVIAVTGVVIAGAAWLVATIVAHIPH